MIRIPRSHLDIFKIQSANIKVGILDPILNYIKIEVKGDKCTLTKSNMKEFVVRDVPDIAAEDISFLVLENILNNFITFSTDTDIEFEQIGNRIKISDGSSFVESPTDRADDFPLTEIPKADNSWIKVSSSALHDIGICAKLVFGSELLDPKSHVFIGRFSVAGTDAMVAYSKQNDDVLPEISLRKDVAESVSKIANCEYSCNSSYDFFRDSSTIYGFSRSEMNYHDVAGMVGKIADDAELSFKMQKSILIKFCNLCLSSIDTKKSIPSAIFYNENGKFILKMEGSDIVIQSNSGFTSNTPRFKFNPGGMKTLLESIPAEIAYFYPGTKRYFITDETKTFVSVIMEII